MSVLGRLKRWYQDRAGLTEARASLERTREMRVEVKRSLGATATNLHKATDRLGRKDWPEQYEARMRDRVET